MTVLPRLILVNGLPGSGKSTLAGLYVRDRALALALDVDTVRGMLGGWQERPWPAGLAARELSLAMARVHLLGGRDVVVPQFLGQPDFVLQLDAVARELGVRFVETALVCDARDAASRFAGRTRAAATRQDVEAAAQLGRDGPDFHRMAGRLAAVIAARPGTRTVVTVDGEVEQSYARLLAAIEG